MKNQPMKLFHQWTQSIHVQMFLRTSLVIVLVISMMTLVLHADMQYRLREQVSQEQQGRTDNKLHEMDIFLTTLMAKTDVLYTNNKFANMLISTPRNMKDNIRITTELKSQVELAMTNVRYAEVAATNYKGGHISSCLYVKNKSLYQDDDSIEDFDAIADEQFVAELAGTSKSFSWSTGTAKSSGPYLAFNRWLLNAKRNEQIALLQVRIPITKLQAILLSGTDIDVLCSYYLEPDSGVICAVGDQTLLSQEQLLSSDMAGIRRLGDREYIVGRVQSALNGAVLLTVQSMKSSNASFASLSSTYFLIGLIGIMLSGILLFMVSHQLMKGLHRLTEKTKLASGNADEYLLLARVKGSCEIIELDDAYIELVKTINTLHAKETEYQAAINEVQAELLQEQFNPHLLYNTLAMVNYMEKANGQTRIATVLDRLIHFYRRVLNRGQLISHISEEVDMINTYLDIVRDVYDIDLQATTDVSSDIMDFYAVKLFMQPIVENAILHGIRQIGAGTLSIRGVREDDMLHFTVEDDGAGMEPDIADEIRHILSQPDSDEAIHSYGYVSVAKRLRLFYGSSYRMSMESEPGEGTRVDMWIPALLEEQISKGLRHRMI